MAEDLLGCSLISELPGKRDADIPLLMSNETSAGQPHFDAAAPANCRLASRGPNALLQLDPEFDLDQTALNRGEVNGWKPSTTFLVHPLRETGEPLSLLQHEAFTLRVPGGSEP